MAGPDNELEPKSPVTSSYDRQEQARIERATELRENDDIAGRGDLVPVDEASVKAGYELKDVEVRPLINAGIGILMLIFISFIVTTIIFGARSDEVNIGMTEEIVPRPEGDVPQRIESRRIEGTEVTLLRETKLFELNNYWIGEEGTVHIPVDRAMELMLAENAFPVRSETSTDPLVEGRSLPLTFSANNLYPDILEQLELAEIENMAEHGEHGEDGE